MDAAALVKQPEDVTENPYRKAAREGRKETPLSSAVAGEVCVVFFLRHWHNVTNAYTPVADFKLFILPPLVYDLQGALVPLLVFVMCLCVEQEEPASQFFFDLGQKKPQHHRRQQHQGEGRKRHSEGDGSFQPKHPRKPRESNRLIARSSPARPPDRAS